ncbi:acyl-(acyl-carrier-protein)--UDP-N-acetylglucosa mineO-acyltransferase [Pirellula staleyi DSM 6068]|uniref:Acyl-(Acyl-carrier-protein)--UDP-N-acetylglucosa mineO-acyltransferase n=1 Tax=Pirellula staleyi (strain ATCC 27377 / DSM 6068 / ICPB 4128) TaxID=530564 RepID=D2QWQ0_PIRSD|nr:acyl-ACP--UDP-N-acetylglucosamine O-acyltransferase [Pirellula staleyi]ADB17853.1 acyl-(acyl-carrier-protein)--UDP-N-acetylglucosa mineO-acyltransferase [Pirellula staleyi DSM 6068]
MAVHVDTHAVVDRRAELADDVTIGPFCVVGPQVKIGRGTKLLSGVTLQGTVTIGEENIIFPGAVIGGDPQDISYQGTDTEVLIGDRNIIREGVTINRGSEKEDGLTTLGNGCFIMAGCHIAHDCRVGSRVIMANATLLGGHVHVQDDATISGGVAVHHFSTIGSYSFTGGLSRVLHDVPPYMLAEGNPSRPRCINIVALKRHQFTSDAIRALSEAHRLIYRARVGLDHARELLRANDQLLPAVNHLISFLQNQHEGRNGRGRDRRRAA